MDFSTSRNVINYLVVYFAIAFSDIPYFYEHKIWRLGLFVIYGALFFYYQKKLSYNLIIIIFIAILLIMLQSLFWSGSLFTIISFTIFTILTPYFAIKIAWPGFLKYYRNILLVYAVISLIFWFGVNFIPGVNSLVRSLGSLIPFSSDMMKESFILYSYEGAQVHGLYRNPGPFHEPGAYSVFLLLAIISEIFINKKLITRINIILITALITAFSTAGFLALFVIIGFYIMTSKRLTTFSKVFIFVFLIGLMTFLFYKLEFLNEKLTSQFETQTSQALHTETSGRFLGARKAIIVISRYPLTGRGLLQASKAKTSSDERAGYGWITWVSQIGLIAGLLYMFFIYKAIKNYSIVNLKNKNFALVAFLGLLVVLAGQNHTSHIFIFMLFLVPVEFPIEKYFREYILCQDKLIVGRKRRKLKQLSFYDYAKFSKKADKK